MRKNLFFCGVTLILVLVLNACSGEKEKKIDEARLVEQMKSLSSLGTVEFSFSKLIKCSDEQAYSIGDRKILMSCKAYVKAGVNFEKIAVTKMDYKSRTIEIELPKGEVILMNIPAEEIKIESQKYGFFRDKFTNKEIQNIQILAEKEIRQKLQDFKVTEKAETNASIFLDKWIRTFGFNNVKISAKA